MNGSAQLYMGSSEHSRLELHIAVLSLYVIDTII